MITKDYFKCKIEEGTVHTANFNKSAVADLATTSLRVKANNLTARAVITVQATTNFTMKSYSGTTYTTAGTAPEGTTLSLFNRVLGANDVDALVTFDPTVNALGTKRGSLIVPGGVGPKSTGGESQGSETILIPGEDLLLVFQCMAGAGKTGDLNVVLDWYQETYTAPTVLPQLKFTDLVVTDTSVVVIPIVPAFDEDVHYYTIETEETAVIIDTTSPSTFTKGQGVKQLDMGVNTFQLDGYKDGYEPCRYEITITRV